MAVKKKKLPKQFKPEGKPLNLWGSGTGEDESGSGFKMRMFAQVPYGNTGLVRLRPLTQEEYHQRNPPQPGWRKGKDYSNLGPSGYIGPAPDVGGGGSSLADRIIEASSKDLTPHEKTEKLKNELATTAARHAQTMADVESGAVKTNVPGMTKKHKGFWERNVGAKLGGAYHELAESVVGDVTKPLLDYLDRPSQALIGGLTGAINRSELGVADPETVEEARKRLGHLSDEQIANIESIQAKWKHVHDQSIASRVSRGWTGKEKYSFVDQIMADQIRNKDYKNPKGGEKIMAYGVGGLMGGFYDPTNVIAGPKVVSRGVSAAKAGSAAVQNVRTARKGAGVIEDVTKVGRDSEEVISGVKAAGHAFEADKAAAKVTKTLQAPRELEQFSQSTVAAQKAAQGFEFTNEAQHAIRAQEIAADAQKASKITDATDAGLKSLEVATRKAAKERALAERLVRSGKITPEEVAAKVAAHDALLNRYNEATHFRSVAQILPVGGKLSLLEKRAARYARLLEKSPKNAQLVKKAAETNKALQAARLAEIPANAEKISDAARKLAAGRDITKAEVEAVTHAPGNIQDELIAMAKASEAMPGKASVVDAILAGGKAVGKAAPISAAAELPSSRMMQAIHKAVEDAREIRLSGETLTDAAKITEDVTSEPALRKLAVAMSEDMKAANRKWSKGTVTGMVGQKLLGMAEDEGVLAAAVRQTGRKIDEIQAGGDPLISSVRKGELLNESVQEVLMPMGEKLEAMLLEGSRKRFAMPFLRKDLGEFQPIGKMLTAAYVPFELVGKRAGATALGRGFNKSFRVGAHFEGETNYIRQMAENSGTVEHKKWAGRIRETFKGMSRSEARQITHAIEDGTTFEDLRMQNYLDQALAMRDEIFDELTKLGKYVPGERVKNYIYHFYHSRNKAAIADMKKNRLSDMKAGLPGPTLDTVAQAGLKPEMDIDKILTMQHRDYVSELQRISYRQEVMSRFGVMTDNAHLASGLGLEEVSVDKLNRMFQDNAKTQKAKYFLPPEIHKTFKAMDDMMGIGWNPEADGILRGFDSVVRGYKTMATVGNPANWINNTVGDFFLNWIDDVRSPLWYTKSMKAVLGAEDAPRTIAMAGSSTKTTDLLRDFRKKAPSGGYIRTEGSSPLSRARGTVTGIPVKAGKRVQGIYEGREEWVRFAHFLSATDDEARKLIKAGRGANFEAVREIATENAAKRVAKWNIDYSELTPFERQLRKRYIPFYTFMRKASPLMLEGMITRPGKINHYTKSKRMLEQFMGVPPEEDDGTVWPEWTKEQGITRLTSEDEPLYLREMSPLNVLNRMTQGDSIRDLGLNMLNQASPLVKAPLEGFMGQSLYNKRPIDDWKAWWANQIPAVSIGARALGHPLSPQKSTAEGTGKGTALIERLSTVGIPIGRNTEARQQAALHQQINKFGNTIKEANKGLESYGYEIKKTSSPTKGTYFLLKGPDGSTIAKYRDFNDALRSVQDL